MADQPVYPEAQEHPLPWNLDDEVERKEFTNLVRQWRDDDDAPHVEMWKEWDNVDLRMSSQFFPVGWTQDSIEQLRMRNDPTVSQQQNKDMKLFISVNRTRPNHESGLGDYLSIDRKLNISAENPQDRNRARVIQRIVRYIEKKYMLPVMIYFPMMDNAWSKGLHWVKMKWNPNKAALKGMFEPEEISCRDVLVDNQARGVFFSTRRRTIHRFKVDVKDAKKMFRMYPHFRPEQVGPDTDYDRPWLSGNESRKQQEQATFYYIEFRQNENRYYFANPKAESEEDAVKEISEAQYDQMQDTPELAPFVFYEEEEAYYIALYHDAIGVFHLKYNPFGTWLMIPLVDIETPTRLYPMGDVVIYQNLQDLFDVLVTIFVENAKRANIPIGIIDKEYWESDEFAKMQETINSALRKGGAVPGITGIEQVQPINNQLVSLLPEVMGWIQDAVSKHSATMGELPAKQVAKETVQALMAKDRTSQGRKDACLSYTLTQMARVIVKFIAKFMKDPDFIKITDMKPGKEGYIPINQKWTEIEYLHAIGLINGIQSPEEPDMTRIPDADVQKAATDQYEQAAMAYEQQMFKLRKEFENENQVDEQQVPGVAIDGQPSITAEEYGAVIKESNMTEAEFMQAHNVEQGDPVTIYIVNTIDEDLDLSIEYSVDDDFQNKPEFKQNRAFKLREMGLLSIEDFFKEINMPNGDVLAKNAEAENQALALAKQIGSAPPDQQQAVMAILQGVAKAVPVNGQKQEAKA